MKMNRSVSTRTVLSTINSSEKALSMLSVVFSEIRHLLHAFNGLGQAN